MQPPENTISYRRVVELSHPLRPGIPQWPGDPAVRFDTVAELGQQGYFLRSFSMGEHTGTHLASPAAYYADGAGPEALPAASLVAPAVVIDVSRRSGLCLERGGHCRMGATARDDFSRSRGAAVHRLATVLDAS